MRLGPWRRVISRSLGRAPQKQGTLFSFQAVTRPLQSQPPLPDKTRRSGERQNEARLEACKQLPIVMK
ncbi:hypothetical protein NDU88_001527 [Pleurodeles waltl]|uniref:Uncharacterized protein n=1 Tax=Pleurodeles waltl TaxID=8319 RepID=A0AAV7RBV6_PLEWA|nr:hypothetical protein NDU88_001527 [Pleurodeles waltl]